MAMRIENPRMTYQTYWEGLVEEKGRFSGQSLRQALENLVLEIRGKLTLSKCKEYTSKFRSIAQKIYGYTDKEALRLIQRQVPMYLPQKLQKEAGKRRGGNKVKLSGIYDTTPAAVHQLLTTSLSVPP